MSLIYAVRPAQIQEPEPPDALGPLEGREQPVRRVRQDPQEAEVRLDIWDELEEPDFKVEVDRLERQDRLQPTLCQPAPRHPREQRVRVVLRDKLA